MTTVTVPMELLTIEDWDALEETDANRYWELVDGMVLLNPFPSVGHQLAAQRLVSQLEPQLPDGLVALQHIGVTIEAQFPPTERGPDVVVFPRARAHLDVPRIDPADVRRPTTTGSSRTSWWAAPTRRSPAAPASSRSSGRSRCPSTSMRC